MRNRQGKVGDGQLGELAEIETIVAGNSVAARDGMGLS
jgi:hypothetical protein